MNNILDLSALSFTSSFNLEASALSLLKLISVHFMSVVGLEFTCSCRSVHAHVCPCMHKEKFGSLMHLVIVARNIAAFVMKTNSYSFLGCLPDMFCLRYSQSFALKIFF